MATSKAKKSAVKKVAEETFVASERDNLHEIADVTGGWIGNTPEKAATIFEDNTGDNICYLYKITKIGTAHINKIVKIEQ